MKKFLGAIVSGLAGVLSLVFLAIPAFSVKVMGETENFSGWKLLTDSDLGKADYTSLTWYRIFAWVLVVLAIVMIVVAVLQLLSALNVVKLPAIVNTVAKYALIALAVVAVLTLVANFGLRADVIEKDFGGKKVLEAIDAKVSVGASLWLVSIANILAAVCGNLFVKKAD